MQTLTELSRLIVKWERISLINGAYRVQKAAIAQGCVIAGTHTDCTYSPQFVDELACVKSLLNLPDGIWLGFAAEKTGFTEVLALLVG